MTLKRIAAALVLSASVSVGTATCAADAESAFEDAKQTGTVTALRKVLEAYPNSPVEAAVRAEIRNVYQKRFAHFVTQASTTDPQLIPTMQALVDYLVQADSPTVEVRFRSPGPLALERFDRELAGSSIAPVAEHFGESTSRPRELAIVNRLKVVFASLFPSDQIDLVVGEPLVPLPAPLPPPIKPEIAILYEVLPSRTIYEWDSRLDTPQGAKPGALKFVGIRVTFDVMLRVPGRPDGLPFTVLVRPPERFTVRSSAEASQVYRVMAESAFETLSRELLRFLLRPTSAIYLRFRQKEETYVIPRQ